MNIYGKEFAKKPSCPFCGIAVERPKELQTRRFGEMPVGSCSCGAVYACDVTGRNLGATFIEALVFACNMDWDLAWNIFPCEDYLEELVENYDPESHLIIPIGSFEGRRIRGALYFIRLVQDIQEATGQGVQKSLARATPVSPEPDAKRATDKVFDKKEIEDLVKAYQIDQLIHAAGQDKKIIRNLQRLLYSSDELLRLRTAETLGKVSAVIARKDPGTVSNLLQKLLATFTNPGSSSWGALDTIGEIISNSPDLFIGYIPALYQFLDDEILRPRILKALGRVAQARPDLVRKTIYRLFPYLSDPNPEARGYTVWMFGFLAAPEARTALEDLRDDQHMIEIYENGNIARKSVGQLASEALEKLG